MQYCNKRRWQAATTTSTGGAAGISPGRSRTEGSGEPWVRVCDQAGALEERHSPLRCAQGEIPSTKSQISMRQLAVFTWGSAVTADLKLGSATPLGLESQTAASLTPGSPRALRAAGHQLGLFPATPAFSAPLRHGVIALYFRLDATPRLWRCIPRDHRYRQ